LCACSGVHCAHEAHPINPPTYPPPLLNITQQTKAMEGEAYEPGQTIYSMGDAASHFYVVVSGEVGVWEEVLPSSPGTEPLSASASGGGPQQSLKATGGARRIAGGTGSSAGSSSSTVAARTGEAATSGRWGSKSGAATPASSSGARSTTAGSGSSTAGARMLPAAPTLVEVRRLGPRESFGESELTEPGSRRQDMTRAVIGSSGGAGSGGATAGAAGGGGGWGRSVTKGRHKAGAGAAGGGGTAGGAVPEAAQQAAVVLLALAAEEYVKVLQGRMSRLQEDKVEFLESLPALQGLTCTYLQSLAHCFHQTVRRVAGSHQLWGCWSLLARTPFSLLCACIL